MSAANSERELRPDPRFADLEGQCATRDVPLHPNPPTPGFRLARAFGGVDESVQMPSEDPR